MLNCCFYPNKIESRASKYPRMLMHCAVMSLADGAKALAVLSVLTQRFRTSSIVSVSTEEAIGILEQVVFCAW